MNGIRSEVDRTLAGTGLFVRGAFHPSPEDDVRPLADGRAAGTLVLVGNAGDSMWRAFRDAVPDLSGPNPLDTWIDAQLERAAAALGAEIVFTTRRPWPPVQRWAMKAGGVHRSPINILIHPEYGLWHVYRGALLFAERFELEPPPPAAASPCDSCATKPCLTACPVDAFQPLRGIAGPAHPAADRADEASHPPGDSPHRFDMHACVDHVESAQGRACAIGGCLARRACPVGRAHAYPADEGAFHMAAVVRTVRRWQADPEAAQTISD